MLKQVKPGASRRRKGSSSSKRPFGKRLIALIAAIAVVGGVGGSLGSLLPADLFSSAPAIQTSAEQFQASDIPAYDGQGVIQVGDGTPTFDADDASGAAFESYSNLDLLDRAGVAYAKLGPELLPTEERGDISSVKPSGWKQNFYDFVDQEALYNRSHLIAFSLAGENANEKNLITGTRYMNAQLMVPYEQQVLNYIRDTGNHVMYRVTPIYSGSELVARGVRMEAESVEDNGAGVSYDVFCYNVQPGVEIDYATGDNWAQE